MLLSAARRKLMRLLMLLLAFEMHHIHALAVGGVVRLHVHGAGSGLRKRIRMGLAMWVSIHVLRGTIVVRPRCRRVFLVPGRQMHGRVVRSACRFVSRSLLPMTCLFSRVSGVSWISQIPWVSRIPWVPWVPWISMFRRPTILCGSLFHLPGQLLLMLVLVLLLVLLVLLLVHHVLARSITSSHGPLSLLLFAQFHLPFVSFAFVPFPLVPLPLMPLPLLPFSILPLPIRHEPLLFVLEHPDGAFWVVFLRRPELLPVSIHLGARSSHINRSRRRDGLKGLWLAVRSRGHTAIRHAHGIPSLFCGRHRGPSRGVCLRCAVPLYFGCRVVRLRRGR